MVMSRNIIIKKGRFGFKKGDISSVRANKRSPMGAGPYRYVKYEKKIVYYTYNELYFNGCPKTAFVQIKEMSGILKKANKRVAKVIAEEKRQKQQVKMKRLRTTMKMPKQETIRQKTKMHLMKKLLIMLRK